jgi:hypothetical protein
MTDIAQEPVAPEPENPQDVPAPFIEATAEMMADAPELPEADQTPYADESPS